MRWQRIWVDRAIAPRNLYASVSAVYPKEKIVQDIWLHNMIPVQDGFCPSFREKPVPCIVHAPTSPEIKGTRFVEQTIERLRSRGYEFEYRLIQGASHEDAVQTIRDDADIVVDQLLLGGFGTLAVEGMYYGKPVCCYILEDVRRELYPDCPIVNCAIETLEEKLVWLLENPGERRRLGLEGHRYAKHHFDADRITDRLLDLYGTL
jgi:glycosyltransferase involved in cell wall biosynthesis